MAWFFLDNVRRSSSSRFLSRQFVGQSPSHRSSIAQRMRANACDNGSSSPRHESSVPSNTRVALYSFARASSRCTPASSLLYLLLSSSKMSRHVSVRSSWNSNRRVLTGRQTEDGEDLSTCVGGLPSSPVNDAGSTWRRNEFTFDMCHVSLARVCILSVCIERE